MASAPPSSTTPAEAAAAMLQYITYLNAERATWSACLRGAVDGGPNGDGMFPYTLFDGSTIMIPSTAKLEALAAAASVSYQSQLNSAGEAAQADVTAALGTMEVSMQLTPGGAPVRGSPFMFASRRTQDLNVLPGSDYADWLQCVAHSGGTYKVPASYFTRTLAGVIDPALPPYNVKFDARKAKNISYSAGGNVLTCSDNPFVASDTGKFAMVSNAGASSTYAMLGYIQYVDAGHVTMFSDQALTTPVSFSHTDASEEMVWGTDCTTGLQAAFDAADPASPYEYGEVVVLGGMTMATHLEFGSIGIVGMAPFGCGIYAIPVASDTRPFFRDKVTGKYATLRADNYSIKNLTICGQKYTNLPGCFRNAFQISGGQFTNFVRGAPYSFIEDLSVFEGVWNNISTYGAFGGTMSNILSMYANQVGIRCAFWDLNGVNWRAEANLGAGVYSLMTGGNLSAVHVSYNGANGGTISVGNAVWPDEMGANYTEAGFGNAVTNLRCQESGSHNLCLTSHDPLATVTGGANNNKFTLVTLDDTADIPPVRGTTPANYPAARAMVALIDNLVVRNTVMLATGAGQVHPTNYATNAYYDRGSPSNNTVGITTPGITNAAADWYSGYSAAAPGAAYTASTSSISSRGNAVTVNGSVIS